MKVRAYREGDLSGLVNLWNEACRDGHEFIPYTEEKLKEQLRGAHCILVAVGKAGEAVGFSLLKREWYGEEIRLCARPGPDREEIEGRLLAAIEQEAQTGELVTLVGAQDKERLQFFAARGYKPESSLYQMIVELTGVWPSPQLPSGYLLRSLRSDEEEAFIRVVNEAYEGERLRPGVLAQWEAEAPPFSAEWVQVAEYEGELVAAVVARPDWEFNRYYHAKRGYLGPAATLPSHKGKGLAKALTARALDFLQKQGMESVCLYTWSGNAPAQRVARSLGFRLRHEWKILTKLVSARGEASDE
jgi:ribosomal protein S18 acetylase RimI-like enzyme